MNMGRTDDKYATMTAAELCAIIGQQPRREGGVLKIHCYNPSAHKNGDAHPSMTVYGYKDGKDSGGHCFTCGAHASTNSWLLKEYGVREAHYMPTKTEQLKKIEREKPLMELPDWYTDRLMKLWESLPPLPPAAKEHLAKKGFEPELFEEMPGMPYGSGWRWHTNQVKHWGPGIFMPYMFNGKMVTARLRTLKGDKLSLKGNEGNKVDKHPSWPYNLDAVMTHKRVFVTEGETDCLTINFVQQDVPAVGIPGATSGVAIARLIEYAACYNTHLIVVPDNDEPGREFVKRIRKLAWEYRLAVDVADVPFGKDVNEWYQQTSPEQLQAFFDRYSIKKPAPIVDRLAKVRDVFGSIQDVTSDPSYQDVLALFA
jgi:Toprim-like